MLASRSIEDPEATAKEAKAAEITEKKSGKEFSAARAAVKAAQTSAASVADAEPAA